jgi:hypothetical protein
MKQISEDLKLPEYSFSTKGGTAHITQSRKTVKIYPGWCPKYEFTEKNGVKKYQVVRNEKGKIVVMREAAPNFHGGIGWNDESASFDGTEIIVPSWKSTVKITIDNAFVDPNYLKMLRLMTGAVNLTPFDGMSIGECLFFGCDGTRRAILKEEEDDDEPNEDKTPYKIVWDLTFDFLGAPNRRTWIDNIGYVKKRGWEYLHMLRRQVDQTVDASEADIPEEPEDHDPNYTTEHIPSMAELNGESSIQLPEEQDNEAADESVKKGMTLLTPVACYIEQVYPYADFRLLGFNSIVQ